jgi:hypothetical protein
MEAYMTRAKPTWAEFRWILIASLLVILFASLPTIYAWSQADADHVFTGFVYNTEDGNSYIAKMRLGARGAWLFYLVYTPEDHEGALVYTFYLLLGKIAARLGLSFVLIYHLARAILGLGLLLTVYAFVARFTPDLVTRRVAWALVAIGSGLGWLLTILGATHWLGDLPLDFWVPEAYVFLVLYSLPHLALAEALLLWAILWTLHTFEGKGLRWCLYAGLAAFFMAWLLPFYAGVLAAALGAYLLALLIRRRRIPWREAGLTTLAGLGALPPVAYNAWVFTANDAFATWAAQNHILSPHPLHYLLGLAPLLVPAMGGTIQAIQQREERWLLPPAWVMIVPLLLYIPFNLQRRMIAAVQVPLALLAAAGLTAWFHSKRLALIVYIAVASLSNLLLVTGSLGPIHQQTIPIYQPRAKVSALEWLGTRAEPNERVLASFAVGNVVPVWTDLRTFVGHGPETLHSDQKRDDVRRFFQPQTDEAWRQALLRDFDINYVFYGPDERDLGNWHPDKARYLIAIYNDQAYTIYKVVLEKKQS